METAYYQQSQLLPRLKTAKEKGFKTRRAEDKGLVSVLETEQIA
jgi:predicted glycosyltransferase